MPCARTRPCCKISRTSYKTQSLVIVVSVAGDGELIPCDHTQCQTTVDPGNDCAYVRAVEVALRIIGTHLPLPDLDMFISPTNNDAGVSSVPVFTRSRPRAPRGLYVALPFEYQLHPWQSRKSTAVLPKVASKHPWSKRIGKLFWRGTNSNHVSNHCSLKEVPASPQA